MLSNSEGVREIQGGKLLASFVVFKKDDLLSISQMGGPVAFLEKNLTHYQETDTLGETGWQTLMLGHAVGFATDLVRILSARQQ